MPAFEFVLAGRYKLSAPLGEGGMAAVYRARDLRLNREVAIKILRDELTHDGGFLSRFQREAQTVAGLSHPNIVPVYDVGEENGSHFIVMEYVRGRTLKEAIETGGALPPERASEIMAAVLDGLGYAHAQGLIHRDVKPQNILLATDGTPKLADFGIAHLADGSTTRTAAILGSAHYLSPEQSRGEEATIRSDIYACGVVLYEMLAGRPPFDGPNALAIAHQHLGATPPPLSAPPAVSGAVSRALAKEPENRFADAASFEEALRSTPAPLLATLPQPLAGADDREPEPAPIVRVGDDRLVLRRSARKPYVLAAFLGVAVVVAARLTSTSVWGHSLPLYPSAPYALLPAALAAAVLVMWLNWRSWIYTLDGNAAIVQWGVLSHHRLGVPLRSVAVLELKQTPIDRLLGLGTIEMRARDDDGQEQRVVMEDVARPGDAYDELVRLVGRSVRSRAT